MGSISQTEIVREYKRIISKSKSKEENRDYSLIYKRIAQKANCNTVDDELVFIADIKELNERKLEKIRKHKIKTRCEIMTILWICVAYGASFEDAACLFYALEYNLDTLRDNYDVILQILYYLPVYGDDSIKRYKNVKAKLKEYGL